MSKPMVCDECKASGVPESAVQLCSRSYCGWCLYPLGECVCHAWQHDAPGGTDPD